MLREKIYDSLGQLLIELRSLIISDVSDDVTVLSLYVWCKAVRLRYVAAEFGPLEPQPINTLDDLVDVYISWSRLCAESMTMLNDDHMAAISEILGRLVHTPDFTRVSMGTFKYFDESMATNVDSLSRIAYLACMSEIESTELAYDGMHDEVLAFGLLSKFIDTSFDFSKEMLYAILVSGEIDRFCSYAKISTTMMGNEVHQLVIGTECPDWICDASSVRFADTVAMIMNNTKLMNKSEALSYLSKLNESISMSIGYLNAQ